MTLLLGNLKEKYHLLTKQQRKVADYIMQDPTKATFQNAKQIAGAVGVSQATVLRFTKELGFNSFAEFMLSLQHDMLLGYFPMQKLIKRIKQPQLSQGSLSEICKEETDNVFSLITSIGEGLFQKTCELLVGAKSISFIGCRSSFSLVYYAGFTLAEIFDNISYFSSNADDAYEKVNKLGKHDVLFSICFHRYARRTVNLTRFAKTKQATIIAMTDQLPSPLFPLSDVLLLTSSQSPFYSYVSSMVLLDALIQNLVSSNREHIEKTLPNTVKMLLDNDVYF